jgi:hypothetical protein
MQGGAGGRRRPPQGAPYLRQPQAGRRRGPVGNPRRHRAMPGPGRLPGHRSGPAAFTAAPPSPALPWLAGCRDAAGGPPRRHHRRANRPRHQAPKGLAECCD